MHIPQKWAPKINEFNKQVKFIPNSPYILPTVASNPQTGKASPLSSANYYLTGVKVSKNQDPDNKVRVGYNFVGNDYKDGKYFSFTLGRHGTDDVANWFKQQLGNDRGKTTFNDLPKKLNFAFKGNLDLKFGKGDNNHGLSEYYYKVDDVVIAQGHTGTSNNWWAAGQHCKYIGDHRIQCWGHRIPIDYTKKELSEPAAIVFRRGGEIWDPLSQILNPSDVSTIEYQVPNSVQCIYNATPNAMRLKQYNDGVLSETNLDQLVSPFSSKCFRTELSAEVSFTLANDGNVEHKITMTANTNIKSEPNYDGSYNSSRYLTENGLLGALKVHSYSANQTSIYKIEQKSNLEPIKTADWMADFRDNDQLKGVMIPASHDAGMSTANISHCAVIASPQTTQTQTKDILGQLESGARYFDIRPTLTDSVFGGPAGYFTYHGANDMSCDGQAIVNISYDNRVLPGVLNQALQFVTEHPTETLILKFSHTRGVAAASKDTISKAMASLVKNVFAGVNQSHLYLANRSSDLSELTFGEARGKVIVVLDTTEKDQKFSGLVEPTSGLWGYNDVSYAGSNGVQAGTLGQGMSFLKVFDQYSNSDVFQRMFADQQAKLNSYSDKDYNWFLLSWTLTQSTEDALNTYPTILGMAVRAHAWLPEKLPMMERSNLVYLDNINPDITTPVIYNSTAVTIKNTLSKNTYVSGDTNKDIRLSRYQHITLGSLNNKGNHIVISELSGPICTVTLNTTTGNLMDINNFRNDEVCKKVRSNLIELTTG